VALVVHLPAHGSAAEAGLLALCWPGSCLSRCALPRSAQAPLQAPPPGAAAVWRRSGAVVGLLKGARTATPLFRPHPTPATHLTPPFPPPHPLPPLRDIWAARAAAGEPCAVPPAGRLVDTTELLLAPGASFRQPGRPLLVQRPMGQNDVGMVAWLLTLRTPECPQVRVQGGAGRGAGPAQPVPL
jgi:hypothetical protein